MSFGNVDECAICLESMILEKKEDETIFTSNCGHAFHKECIFLMMNYRNNQEALPCPMCRAPMEATERRFVLGPSESEIIAEHTANKLMSKMILCLTLLYSFGFTCYHKPAIMPLIKYHVTLSLIMVIVYCIHWLIKAYPWDTQ
tara:strand:+ start:415 stop:846 length:432 start_codon:yes stop_codon:yes gene_type:complete